MCPPIVIGVAGGLLIVTRPGLAPRLRWWGGVAITLPVMMLGWIPFRAESLESLSMTFAMWAKLFDPAAYTWLGMRGNVYLFAALLLVGILATHGVKEKLLPRLARRPVLAWAGDSLSVAVMTALVIVFLRPINQFIYFQF